MAGRATRAENIILAFMAVAIVVITFVTVLVGLVHDFGTAGALFSILGFLAAALVFWAARLLSKRMRRARMALLRRDDMSNRRHVIFTISLCKSLALAAEESGPGSPATMSAMRDIALHIGEARAMHGYLLTRKGRRLAEKVHTAALSATSPKACASVNLPMIVNTLQRLDSEVRGIDDYYLVRRREQEADAGDPPRE